MKPTKKLQPIKQIKLFFVLTLSTIFVVLVMSSPSWATVYYVNATNGNDSNPGTSQATPWKTIAKVNKWSFEPGDDILFKKGEIWREQLNVPSSGSSGFLITFGAYGSGDRLIISGADLVIGWEMTAHGNLYLSNCSWVPNQVFEDGSRIDKIEWHTDLSTTYASMRAGTWTLDASNDTLYVWASDNADLNTHTMEVSKRDLCIHGNDKSYIRIDGLQIEKSNSNSTYYGGIADDPGAGGNSSTWVIQDCTLKQNRKAGIWLRAGSSTITGNTIFDNNYGIIHTQGTETTISENTIYENNYWTPGDGIYMDNTRNTIIEKNNIYSHDSGDSSDGIHIGNSCSNAIVRYNIVKNGGSSNIIITDGASNTSVYYNIVAGGSILSYDVGINVWNVEGNTEIYNNTIYNDYGNVLERGIRVETVQAGASVLIKNNLVYSGGKVALYEDGSADESLITIDYNCFYNDSGTMITWEGINYTQAQLSDYQSASGKDANSISQDPVFTNPSNDHFSLECSSPCIDAGENVGLLRDYLGVDIAQGKGVDIGAFEFKKIVPPTNLRIVPN